MALNPGLTGTVLGPETFEYDEDDAILYALAVGCEPDELQFVYEKGLKVLPTFATIPVRSRKLNTAQALGLDFKKLLHGENRIEIPGPLPPKARFSATSTVKGIYDKGSGAVVVTEIEAREEQSGDVLFRNTATIFVRGEGGFGGNRGPSVQRELPSRAPDWIVEMKTAPNQAQLYRLCGDKNLLHVDPDFARQAGFEKPILHGLCTYGFSGRAILREFCGNDPSRLKGLEARFAGVVFPGETLTFEMWGEPDGEVHFQARTAPERYILKNGLAKIQG